MTSLPITDQDAPSIDAFHRGRFVLVQPKNGHRAGLDAMLLAASAPKDFSGRLADLGAGAGAAGLAVAARCPQANIVLVEREAEMLHHAQLTLAHPANAFLRPHVEILAADVTLTGMARRQAGLVDDSFDFVLMNPPFNAHGDRASPDALRRAAHVMEEGLFDKWLRTASALLKPRGGLALIARPQSLTEILTALEGRFGGVRILPVSARANEPAIRIIVRAVRGSRAPLSLLPPLSLHDAAMGGFAAPAEDAISGFTTLFEA